MNVDTIYRYNDLGCYSECKGQFKTAISGGTPFSVYPPYIYEWGGGKSQDTIVFGLCPNSYTLTVTDSAGCSIDTAYLVDFLKSPKVDFKFSPRDTIYLTNPVITIAFADSMRPLISNWTWEFGDSAKLANENPVTHVYEGSGPKKVKLKYTDRNGCDTIYEHELTVKVAELEIPNVFTPNGDTRNDKFEIRLKGESKTEDFRQAYLSNEFEVFDRWGRKVFSKDNYRSEDWDGGNLSDGTYFYVLRCVSYWGNDNYHGAVTILRGNK
jgi:gliding motility-associated-like protein